MIHKKNDYAANASFSSPANAEGGEPIIIRNPTLIGA